MTVHEMVAARSTDQALDDEQRSRKAGLTLRSILKEEAYAPLSLHSFFLFTLLENVMDR